MDDYRLFIKVVELGSFSAAAKHLSLTQPTVSRRIEAIEKELGTRLLRRTGRELKLTGAGQLFYDNARNISRLINKAKRDVQNYSGQRQNIITIAAHESFGIYVLPTLLQQFHAQHPDVRYNLVLQSELDLSFDSDHDFYLQDGKLKDSSMKAKRIGVVRVNAYASPGFIHSHKLVPGTLTSAEGLPCCVLGSYYAAPLKKHLDPGMELENYRHPIYTNDLNTLIHFAEKGFGIIFLADIIARPSVENGQLIKLNKQRALYSSTLYLLYHSNRALSPVASSFKQFFTERFTELLEQ